MNKALITSVVALLLPVMAFAATTDFTANGNITVSGVTFSSRVADMLILNGSTAQSWSFSNGTFTVTNPGTFQVGSSDNTVKSIQISSGGTTLVCSENTTPGTSYATVPSTAGTYTITPSSTIQCTSLCSVVSNATSYNSFPTCGAVSCNTGYTLSGSGASGTCVAIVNGSILPGYNTPNPLPGASTHANTVITTSPVSVPSVSAIFTNTLKKGMENSNVRRLQTLLASDSYLYPEGLVTGYYGNLTEQAVQRFQSKYNIVSSGTPQTTGFGLVGPQTREKLQKVFGGAVALSVSSSQKPTQSTSKSYSVLKFSRVLSVGSIGNDVKRLQKLLNRNPDTNVAETGVGSPGKETNYFGKLTERAVQKFQAKYNIVSSGTPQTTGFGLVGPQTREKLNEL